MFIEDLPLTQTTVLLRVDFNVPLVNQQITDSRRIDLALPTIRYLLSQRCKIILLSHLGRPQTEAELLTCSLAPVSEYLNQKLDTVVKFFSESYGPAVQTAVANLEKGQLLVLENTRFNDLTTHAESRPSQQLARFWANLADFFVFDAFATLHREHTSTYTILSHFKPSQIGHGYLLRNELMAYRQFLQSPLKRPFVVIIGGGKPASKIPIIQELVKWADRVIICGALAFPFLKALGHEVGQNLPPIAATSLVRQARTILATARTKIVLPVDFATTQSFEQTTNVIKPLQNLLPTDFCLDCGPGSLALFESVCQTAQAVFWNGPPGVFERPNFTTGTRGILAFLAKIAKQNCQVVIGGGDSAAAASQFGYPDQAFTHVSTGGGASLGLLQSTTLPVLTALKLEKQFKLV